MSEEFFVLLADMLDLAPRETRGGLYTRLVVQVAEAAVSGGRDPLVAVSAFNDVVRGRQSV